jgi:hypothetical protein
MNREVEVAFSKKSQPLWFRILKYIVLFATVYFLWGTKWLWIVLSSLFAIALALHFWMRYKTNGWTKSYGLWDFEKNKPGNP